MSRKLHIGGTVRKDGWEVINALPGDHVDHLGNANDLSRFEDGTFETVYGSHILEHLDYNGELLDALKEWVRVLRPGGELMVSVPDMETLCRMFLAHNELSAGERFEIMRMMFGGHVDEYDYHVVGLDAHLLNQYLLVAGFMRTRRVGSFALFNDTSEYKFKGVPISLNIIAEKPKAGETAPVDQAGADNMASEAG